jgi:hypothetical protein
MCGAFQLGDPALDAASDNVEIGDRGVGIDRQAHAA